MDRVMLIAAGVLVGWLLRGSLDAAIARVIMRILTHERGKEAILKALLKMQDTRHDR